MSFDTCPTCGYRLTRGEFFPSDCINCGWTIGQALDAEAMYERENQARARLRLNPKGKVKSRGKRRRR